MAEQDSRTASAAPATILDLLQELVGQVSPTGTWLWTSPHWPLCTATRSLADSVEPGYEAQVTQAIECGREGAGAEFTAPLRGGSVRLRWRLCAADADSFHVLAAPEWPDATLAHAGVESVAAGIAVSDAEGRFLYVNPAYGAIYGYSPAELQGRMFTDMLQPADREWALDRHKALIRGEFTVTEQEYRIERRTDEQTTEPRVVSASSNRLQLPQGVVRLATVIDVTDLRANERTLVETEARYQHIFEHTSEGIFRSSRDGRLLEVNWPLVAIHQCGSKEELIASVRDLATDWFVWAGDRERMLTLLDREGKVNDFEAEIYRIGTGERFWANENTSAIYGANGELLHYQGTIRDITDERRQRELATRRAEILEMIARDDDLTAILYEIVGAIEQTHTRLTVAVCRLCDGLLEVLAAPALDPGCIAAIDGNPPSEVGGPIAAAMRRQRPVFDEELPDAEQGRGTLARAMREPAYGNVMALPVRDQGEEVLGVLAVFVASRAEASADLPETLNEMAQIASLAFEQQRLTESLRQQAQYDILTGLPNRILFNDRLQQLIHDAERSGVSVAVMMLDLDEFKLVNDTLGHQIGDLLLTQVAQRMESCLRAGDTVARFGGDEFVLLMPLDRGERASDIAERLVQVLYPAIPVEGNDLHARPSIGISLFPQDGQTATNLIQAADTAMYAAKEAGKNCYRFFAESMNAEVSYRLRTTTDLREALRAEQLVLYYQPTVACDSERIIGGEALLRWRHPVRGLLMPGEFLPVAERSDLIREIDSFVLGAAVSRIAQWQRRDGEAISIAINLSARALHEGNFAAEVAHVLEQHRVSPTVIELEITESMVMRDFDRVVGQLRDLRERAPGLRIAVDDFGTGHASLAYLRQLPVDMLKIDRTFVAEVDYATDDRARDTARAIVRAVIELGRNLGLTVVGEGVETRAQADFLRMAGCHRACGYLFSRPLDETAFGRLIGDDPPDPR